MIMAMMTDCLGMDGTEGLGLVISTVYHHQIIMSSFVSDKNNDNRDDRWSQWWQWLLIWILINLDLHQDDEKGHLCSLLSYIIWLIIMLRSDYYLWRLQSTVFPTITDDRKTIHLIHKWKCENLNWTLGGGGENIFSPLGGTGGKSHFVKLCPPHRQTPQLQWELWCGCAWENISG